MKVTYTIRVRPDVALLIPPSTEGLMVGRANIGWQLTEDGHLETLALTFTGAEMRYNENGAILPTYPELEEEAYRVCSFVANRIFVQTGLDAIEADEVLLGAPAIAPENVDEERKFKTKYKSVWKGDKTSWSVRGLFEPAGYCTEFNHSAAHGYFADALRAGSGFQQFELLYKVVEYFFPEESAALDAAVSSHVAPHDATYTPAVLEQLRFLRNRSIHPRARKGHVNPQSIAQVREVHSALPQMRRLSNLLLAHPTF